MRVVKNELSHIISVVSISSGFQLFIHSLRNRTVETTNDERSVPGLVMSLMALMALLESFMPGMRKLSCKKLAVLCPRKPDVEHAIEMKEVFLGFFKRRMSPTKKNRFAC